MSVTRIIGQVKPRSLTRRRIRFGFAEFWTIISKQGLELFKLMNESPTTNHWFDVAEVLARKGKDWDDFRQRLAGACGIPVSDSR